MRQHSERLEGIAERSAGERGSRTAAGALVLRALEASLEDAAGAEFLLARAAREVEALGRGSERRALVALVEAIAGDPSVLPSALVRYAGALESVGRVAEADVVVTVAGGLAPEDAEVLLHAGRLARKVGDAERARRCYRRAAERDRTGGRLARLALLGEALVSERAEADLGRAIRHALRAGDAEAAAIGLEERARIRREGGDAAGAARDLAVAVLRHPDDIDRGRAAHLLADVGVATGDPLAAREALIAALAVGDDDQKRHARARLHGLSRDLGDRLGMRRWRSSAPPPLVAMGLYARPRRAAVSAAPRLARWRRLAESR